MLQRIERAEPTFSEIAIAMRDLSVHEAMSAQQAQALAARFPAGTNCERVAATMHRRAALMAAAYRFFLEAAERETEVRALMAKPAPSPVVNIIQRLRTSLRDKVREAAL